MRYVDHVFRELFAQEIPDYKPREGQIEMAHAVANAFEGGDHLMAEGPTGTGKSFAYLVPAVHFSTGGVEERASQKKRTIMIGTANIALQEQLVAKDLPFLQKVLPWPFEFALLKGVSNYACLDKVDRELEQSSFGAFEEPGDEEHIERVLAWVKTTETGDRSELEVDPPGKIWSKFSTSSDECKGSDCAAYKVCHAYNARRRAKEANVVVVNFHLLFVDLRVKLETGEHKILPEYHHAILDEVHEAPDIAREFFGVNVSQFGISRAVNKLGSFSELGREVTDKHAAIAKRVKATSQGVFEKLKLYKMGPLYDCRIASPDPVKGWDKLVGGLLEASECYAYAADVYEEGARDTDGDRKKYFRDKRGSAMKSAAICQRLAGDFRDAMQLSDDNQVYFLEDQNFGKKDSVAIRSKVVHVSRVLEPSFFREMKSVVCTSATLSDGADCSYVAGELGVPRGREEIQVESPFDFEAQSALVVPAGLPHPAKSRPQFDAAVPQAVLDAIDTAKGGTLALFTSWRNLKATAAHIRKSDPRVRLLVQGEAPRTKLVEMFKADRDSVLLGLKSFWQGVDVPGDALRCVVIDRIPFETPNDPLVKAISEQNPDGWFLDFAVPRAVIALKQAFGRLVRTVDDVGVVVVLDNRITTTFARNGRAGYGEKFIRALPVHAWERDFRKARRLLA
jgi:ATP-dependent DNA helicase DinG